MTELVPRALRLGPLSAVLRPRSIAVVGVTGLLAILLAVVSTGVGDFSMTPARVLEVLAGHGSRREELVLLTVRLPRVLVGLLVGAAFGISGALVQTVARNSLASPDLLGVTAGASAGAVAVIVLGGDGQVGGALRSVGVPLAALLGGLLTAVLVALLLRVSRSRGLVLILVGVGVSSLLGGLVSWMLVEASIQDAARATVWITGSLNGRSWAELWPVLAAVLVSLPVLLPLSTRLPALSLGRDLSTGLGVDPVLSRVGLLAIAVLLASVATSSAGPIAFVALVAPHLSTLAAGTPRPSLAASGTIGALLVVASDLLARLVVAPLQLPVGAVTALLGAPFLVWLLLRSRQDTRA